MSLACATACRERLCDSQGAVSFAHVIYREAQRNSGAPRMPTAIGGASFPELLQIAASQPDRLRQILSAHNSEIARQQEEDAPTTAVHASEACPLAEGELVLAFEWRWLAAKALGLEGGARETSDGVDLQLLFSSRRDGCSLHTLAEKAAGFTRGTLLVCKDHAGFIFGGWADGGLHPYPAARNEDSRYSGNEQCKLVRLFPSLAVIHSRRSRESAEPQAEPPASRSAGRP